MPSLQETAGYRLPRDQYEEMLDWQGGGCYICRRAPNPSRRLAIDHDHSTGLIRGLLCQKCNLILAMLGDDLDGVMRFVEYLRSAAEERYVDLCPRCHVASPPLRGESTGSGIRVFYRCERCLSAWATSWAIFPEPMSP